MIVKYDLVLSCAGKSFLQMISLYCFSSFVKETMDSTGTSRKPLVEYALPQNRTKSLPSYATRSTVEQNQHFSSRTPPFRFV